MSASKTFALCAAALAAALSAPAHAVIVVYSTNLTGAAESPPVASPATGQAFVTFDTVANTMRVQTTWSGLVGTTTVAHIHCCTTTPNAGTAGVFTFPGTFPSFPVGVTSGSYDQTINMALTTSYTAAALTAGGGTAAGAFNTLLAGINTGSAYFNIHSSFAPGGEIRGFLAPIPEPGTYALMLAGLGAVGGMAAWRRRREQH